MEEVGLKLGLKGNNKTLVVRNEEGSQQRPRSRKVGGSL